MEKVILVKLQKVGPHDESSSIPRNPSRFARALKETWEKGKSAAKNAALALVIAGTIATANAQEKPKPPPTLSEKDMKIVRELEKIGPVLTFEQLYAERAKTNYIGIFPSHKGIDVSKVQVRGARFCDVEVHEDSIVFS
ncbi:MAG: hypothetical protein N3F07_01250, partial [Candidatus Micrarchaeota archaeon]|nr:hypothetical protein [Candidatus Micrarchaeota archaeon]